jgi:Phage baseplate assembly protein W
MPTATDSDFLGRGWAFPVIADSGKVQFVQGNTDIKQAIVIILTTAPGERVMMPEFGCRINELLFAANNSSAEALAKLYVQQAIDRWEPRVKVTTVEATIDFSTRNTLTVSVNYCILDKNQPDNLVYPFYLKGR